jgi:hypothetical protein
MPMHPNLCTLSLFDAAQIRTFKFQVSSPRLSIFAPVPTPTPTALFSAPNSDPPVQAHLPPPSNPAEIAPHQARPPPPLSRHCSPQSSISLHPGREHPLPDARRI